MVLEHSTSEATDNQPRIIFEAGILGHIPDIMGNRSGLIVCDSNTYLLLKDSFRKTEFVNIKIHLLHGRVLPFETLVDDILALVNSVRYELLVALGSGTITDICKRVSYLAGLKCIIFPTAVSVNAYTSGNSSIILSSGKKVSLKASIADEIYIDSTVLFNAPKALVCSGFADLVCRSAVEPDCLLSHLILDTFYDPSFFAQIKQYEEILLNNYKSLLYDESLVKLLMEGLLFSGAIMEQVQSSIMASQGEHQIAHIIESTFYSDAKSNIMPLHGEMVALGTLYMIKLQNKILQNKYLNAKYKVITKKEIESFYGLSLSEEYFAIYSQKNNLLKSIDFAEIWKGITEKMLNKLADYDKYRECFQFLSLPTKCQDLYLNEDMYHKICKTAFFTRGRFTFLDLAYYSSIEL